MTCCRTLRLFLLAGMQFLRGPLGTSAAESPCPDVFQYEGSSGSEYGIITVPNPYPYLAIDISVAIYVTAPVPSGSPTKLEPVDRDMWSKLAAGSRDPVLYRLDFPVSSPLPTIKSIVVNQNVICRGTKPNAEYLTTITVQHSIFNNKCNSASLECSFNIRQSPETMPPPPLPPPQNVDSSSPTSPCPDVFRYELDRSGNWHGIISVPNPYPVVAIDIRVELYVAAVASTGNGRLELVNSLSKEWERMRTGEQYFVQYRLDFPVRFPLPTVKSIVVNNQQICRGGKPNSVALTTLSFQHALFNQKCTSASLDCPDNTIQIGRPIITERPVVKPPPPKEPPIVQEPPPPPPPTPKPKPPGRQPVTDTNTRCGFPVVRTNPLIINGQSTTHGQWPWHAALYRHQGYDTVYQCGGSFVGTRTIITAAHCVTTRNGEQISPKDFTVFLGRYDLRNHREEGIQQKDVHTIFIHSEFNYTYFKSDLAMLLLNSSVEFTAQVRPVCLWNPSDTSIQSIIGKDGVVVGWGLDEYGMTADKLKMIKMPVVAQDTCIRSHINFFSRFTHETTFCAGFINGSSVCNGDSGGGMVFPEVQRDDSQIWKLRGIVSNSRPDDNDSKICNTKSYIVFTDIAQYLEWINLRLI
uniref:Putative serine protease 30 n=1 Tax=Reticulitermes speratus TaxID=60591 RepID=A0A1V1FKK2_9NEOP